ncbi:DUF1798 family protein [Paraliobacillus ryukyuensis]|uniref:DUF1798 family protein n=1 Tax=Paraliobacillus ryukyuensis TaxID=200904 RepID=UPI000DEA9FD2|nr:DUF1798 family protein [Paraliobacillus ryukyuensis]
MSVKELTFELKEKLAKLKTNYYQQEKPEYRRDPEFFNLVKEETLPVFQLAEKWSEETAKKVKERELRIHPQQVASTKENVELLLMHSYYIDVKETRYMNLYNSVQYVLDIILEDLA